MVGLGVVPLIALALACWRTTRFITDDSFPPMAWLRAKVASIGPAAADLIECPFCVSIYVGIGAVCAVEFAPAIWVERVSLVLALSAVASLVALIAEG